MSESDQELFNLAMSEDAQPLMYAVKKHIEENVDPITDEFFALDKGKEDRWVWHPRQMELLDGAKAKAKESGLWNFFLPDADTGEGLSNLDYAYIAAELGKIRWRRRPSIVVLRIPETWKYWSEWVRRHRRQNGSPRC